MELQKLYSLVRQAIEKYNMIDEGDKIAIGISGGKDSLGLLYALSGISHFYPKHFEIIAINIDLGYENFDISGIANLCNELDVKFYHIKTQIGEIIKDKGCSLCSKLRKGALFDAAKEHGCNKVAYGHNMDDMVETMMLSLIYEGRFSTFYPVIHFNEADITIIRPFIYVTKAAAIGFKNKYNLPTVNNPCPFDSISERTYIRNLLNEINQHAPGVKHRMMTAIQNGITFPTQID